MERTAMSARELGRAAVLAQVKAQTLALREAAVLLGVTYRQAKRLWARYRAGGAKALVHRSVGRRSNRAWPAPVREAVLALVRAHYGGAASRGPGQRFGPTLVAEHLWCDHGLLVPVATLTRWLRAAGLWSRARRGRPRHRRRERKAHFGELVQLDGSFHDWFEGRGPRACLMTLIDDATGTTLLRFGAEETTWAAAGVLRAWVERYGIPRALYTDWKSVYQRAPSLGERLRGEPAVSRFGRMGAALGIQLIGAASPQAKGRVERGHGTHQDRLIKKMRLLGIGDVAAANAYLEQTYLPAHNGRFAIAPASPADYHRPWDQRRQPAADVFCLETVRTVANDYVVQYRGRGLQLDRAARGRVPAKSQVVVRETEDGQVRVIHVSRDGGGRALVWTPAAPRTVKPLPVAASTTAREAPPRRDPHPWREQHWQWMTQGKAARERREAAAQTRLAATPAQQLTTV
jgi:hypothetical protein